MSRIEHKLGLTAIFKRLAFHYLQKGVGSHGIEHPVFDEVVVRPLYDWHTPNDEKLPPRGGLIVEFMREGRRVRWAEFGVQFSGGGGEPLIREV